MERSAVDLSRTEWSRVQLNGFEWSVAGDVASGEECSRSESCRVESRRVEWNRMECSWSRG